MVLRNIAKSRYFTDQQLVCKKQWFLVALAHANRSLDGVGVALKVKGRHSNDDLTC